ncbi:TonB-dependent receptor [Pseudoalteromonas neustonica]|uniref:TonB-dependent receptor n=1 Tax=Pseudoalteromonas neustonica TaxID=1840331 RepID=A0ABU9U0W8_9GAMM
MKRNKLSVTIAMALATTAITPLYAAEEANSPEEISKNRSAVEVIQVTATKRSESIQTVPVSVSALSGGQLDALGISDTTEITQQIPGFQVNAFSPQLTIFNLRGISQNSFVDNLEAPIAVYQDESYISSMNAISGQMFDIERVEVLRGPQGTLFGRNATGGLVHYLSAGATEDYTNGYIELGLGSFNRQILEGAIGGELADNVRGRFAFRHETADGYIKADTSIASVDPRAIGGADGYGMRATIEVDFSDTLMGTFIIKHSKDNDVPTGGYAFENCPLNADGFCDVDIHGRAIVTGGVASGDVYKHQNDTRGFLNREVNSYTAKLVKSFDDVELVSITNHMSMDKSYLEDSDAFPDPIVVFGQDAEISQFSQEFRLSHDTGALKWQLGAFYMDFELDGTTTTLGAPNIDLSFSLADAGLISKPVVGDDNPFDGFSSRPFVESVENSSIFGQIDYNLTEQTTLTAGLRYSKDEKDINWTAFFTSDDQIAPILYGATANNTDVNEADVLNYFTEDSISYSDYAGRLSLSHQFNKDVMGFVSWNRGIKGGNWTLSSGVSPDRFVHDPETLNSYEAGVKASITDSTRLNATVFYYDYDDYQTFVSVPPGQTSPNPQVGNSDAKSAGAEFELVSSVTENLDVMFGISILNSKVEMVEAGGNPILDAEFPSAPAISGNYLARHFSEIGDAYLIVQFDGAFYGEQFLEVTNGPGTKQHGYNISNLGVTYETESWSFSLKSKNIFDVAYKAYTLDLGALGATSYYAPGRTFLATVKYSFE